MTFALELTGRSRIVSIERAGPARYRVIVDDVGTAVPAVVDALGRQGTVVSSTREDRPTFDEVFAALVLADAARPHGDSAADVPKREAA